MPVTVQIKGYDDKTLIKSFAFTFSFPQTKIAKLIFLVAKLQNAISE